MDARLFVAMMLIPLCSGCANLRPIDITNPAQQPAVLCDLTGKTAYADHVVRTQYKQVLIYPNTDLRSIQIAFTGQYQMKAICTSDMTCEIARSGNMIRITKKPLHHPEMIGYSEVFQFDQAKKTLNYSAGGGMDFVDLGGFFGKCKASPKVIDD